MATVAVVDAEAGWTFASGLCASRGAQNPFDELPGRNPWSGVAGAACPVHPP